MLSALGVKNFKEKQGEVNYVTEYDEKVQAFLIEEIKKAYPRATFIAEEKDNDSSAFNSELCFIIDPIDGTANFIRDYKTSSISIGVFSKGVGIFGAILNPYLNELFTAEKGKGAYLNGEKITVSNRDFEKTVFAFGSSPYYKKELGEKTFDTAKKLFFACEDIRRSGSAALDFCNVACGRIDLFFECRLSPWDFGAGSIILTEAGGIITDMDGNDLDFCSPQSILCGNPKTHKKALEIINEKRP
ncbi:MAG: inositol monophosphatase [Clostridia bacterium]|nr:inositol monophosphatase [Clostridia bacterium]